MEKSLLGHAAPSSLPAGAGLGTASIDFNSRSIEISSGEEWGGRGPCDKEASAAPAVWMGSQWDLLSGSPVAMSPLCHGWLHGGDMMSPMGAGAPREKRHGFSLSPLQNTIVLLLPSTHRAPVPRSCPQSGQPLHHSAIPMKGLLLARGPGVN